MVDGVNIDPNGPLGKIQVGERFEITNPDKPAWCNGWFEALYVRLDGTIVCRRVEGPNK